MTFATVALGLIGYEALAYASRRPRSPRRVPTITEVMGPRPVWQQALFIVILAGITLDHWTGPILP